MSKELRLSLVVPNFFFGELLNEGSPEVIEPSR
jgi:hypothetical protein